MTLLDSARRMQQVITLGIKAAQSSNMQRNGVRKGLLIACADVSAALTALIVLPLTRPRGPTSSGSGGYPHRKITHNTNPGLLLNFPVRYGSEASGGKDDCMMPSPGASLGGVGLTLVRERHWQPACRTVKVHLPPRIGAPPFLSGHDYSGDR